MKNPRMLTAVLALSSALVLAACEDEGPVESLGEAVDESVESVGDAVEDATDQ